MGSGNGGASMIGQRFWLRREELWSTRIANGLQLHWKRAYDMETFVEEARMINVEH